MTDFEIQPRSETLGMDDLQTEFLSLKVGEEIPKLQVKEIRKVINSNKENNLSGVDFKYIIESTDQKVLMVNSWALWKKIAAAIQDAGSMNITLEVMHLGVAEYSVRVV